MGRRVQGAGHGEQGMVPRERETGHGQLDLDKAVSPLQYHMLPWHYQFLLVTAFLILSLTEGSRLYLGYLGNLQEKVSTICPGHKAPCAQ